MKTYSIQKSSIFTDCCNLALDNLENSPEERKALVFKVNIADSPRPTNSAPPFVQDCSSKHIARDASKLSLCCCFFSHAYPAINFCKILFLRYLHFSIGICCQWNIAAFRSSYNIKHLILVTNYECLLVFILIIGQRVSFRLFDTRIH